MKVKRSFLGVQGDKTARAFCGSRAASIGVGLRAMRKRGASRTPLA
ncbi:hypothetical protein COLSTE_02373 [Collinsella stercoris DSM 13279]|uniref:Uncharacterized protein n=1 Tax=Collinsella stercoris DSM 13279 TaxID=445975 RepID=B6GE36_9ACTN|nr:hypothetical protein COLSTE_02373 [Collinsella stercoris DSM 13279]